MLYKIKDTTKSNTSASFMDLLLSIGSNKGHIPVMTNG